MTLTRQCICPMVLTRGADQMPVSSKFEMRNDPSVLRNYGRLLAELAAVVPDGLVAFFVSYSYMDMVIGKWHEMGLLDEILAHKLIFIEVPPLSLRLGLFFVREGRRGVGRQGRGIAGPHIMRMRA